MYVNWLYTTAVPMIRNTETANWKTTRPLRNNALPVLAWKLATRPGLPPESYRAALEYLRAVDPEAASQYRTEVFEPDVPRPETPGGARGR